jgi:hypothetical protein
MVPVSHRIPDNPIKRLTARNISKEDIVAAGDRKNLTTDDSLRSFHSHTTTMTHIAANIRLSGNDIKDNKASISGKITGCFRQ